MPQRIFIHANSVHQGGGRSLLLSLLDAVSKGRDWFATLDERLAPLSPPLGVTRIRWVAHSLIQRLASEWWLARHVGTDDVLLCFGNLPPLFRSRGRVVVFIQNRYLIESLDIAGFPLVSRWRLRMERLWLNTKFKNADLFVVQTPTMRRLLQLRFVVTAPITVLPFVGEGGDCARSAPNVDQSTQYRFDFLYVASGEPHKNHRNLIEAWCLLAEANQFPSLYLTVDASACPELCRWIEARVAQCKLAVRNLGSIPQDQVLKHYAQARALIFPSQFESFGLPLIEARQAGLPVLASEADYVRDIMDPEETFDPDSPLSIARAVRRFLGQPELPLTLLDAAEFINAVLATSKLETER